MSNRAETRHPVAQSILVVAALILVFSLGVGVTLGGLEPSQFSSLGPVPLLIAIACVMVPTAAGAAWFRLKGAVAMSAVERLQFAAGVVAANLTLPIGGFAAGLALLGETQTLAKHSMSARDVLAHYILGTVVSWEGLLVQLLIFAQAYVLGLVLTHR